MLRIFWVLALMVCVANFVFGQTQSNPFDLTYRPSNSGIKIAKQGDSVILTKPAPVFRNDSIGLEIPSLSATDTSKAVSDNPFEIKDKDEAPAAAAEEITVIDDRPSDPEQQPEHRKPSKGIQIFFLLISLLFLIFIVNVERNFVRDLWKVISNENYSSLHLRNQRNTMRQILLLMGYFVFIVQAGIFLYHTLVLFGYEGTLFDNIWTCMALILSVYMVRHMVIGYLRWLFNNEKEMTLSSFDISIFNIMVGLVLLPINVLMNFGPETLLKPLIIIGLIVVAMAYVMRQLRRVLTARQLITNSLFLFFVYLCAVEILPLWAISKFFW